MKKLYLCGAIALALTGCASIINDKTQKVNVSTSNGSQVSGTVNGQPFSAPGVVDLTRENKSKVFVADSAKCKGETVADKTVDPIFFINLISGGVFGSSTDYGTEKMWKYADNITINCK